MRRFRDRLGRTWDVDVNVSAIKRVRDLLGVDLYSLVGDGLKPLAELLGDPVKLVDVIYTLIDKQAKAAGVSDEDFGRSMAGESIQSAAEEFVEELFDFFPDQRQRLTLRKIRAKVKEVAEAMADEGDRAIDTLRPAEVLRRMAARSGSPGVSPASSASTPEPGRSPDS